MSLFNDDFFSTKVSRRARAGRRISFTFPRKVRSGKWSTIRIALVSSITGAVAATMLFWLLFGATGDGRALQAGASASETVDISERFIQASAMVRPAVVSVINEQMFPFGIGGDTESNGSLQEASVGSGFIVEKRNGKAYIVTNNHVISNAVKVQVVMFDGEKREARVVGQDQITDLAVLEIDAKGVDTLAAIGDSSKLRAAEFVMAIGNPLGLHDSLSYGIVSRTLQVMPVSLNQDGIYDWEQEVIQINASINKGNSGGPLIDLNGKVVGINSMKISEYGVEGIAFAIPINNAMPIVNDIIEQGYFARPYLGVSTIDLEQYWGQIAAGGYDPDEPENDAEEESEPLLELPDEVYRGVIVLEASGPAKKAGLQFNDVIVTLDRQSVGSTMELRKYLYGKTEVGDEIEIGYYRDGKLQTVKAKLSVKELEK